MQIIGLETSKHGQNDVKSQNMEYLYKTLINFFLLDREGLELIVLPWKCHSEHTTELCEACNNCTEFQFYKEKVVKDILFFVILHHFVSLL